MVRYWLLFELNDQDENLATIRKIDGAHTIESEEELNFDPADVSPGRYLVHGTQVHQLTKTTPVDEAADWLRNLNGRMGKEIGKGSVPFIVLRVD